MSLWQRLRKFTAWMEVLLAGLIGMTLGVFLLIFVMAGEIYDYSDSVDGVHLPPVDAIVCLAGGRGRIAMAGDVWYRYWELSQGVVKTVTHNPVPKKPPLLYISGMGRGSTWPAFSHQLRRGVLEAIQPSDVVLETESYNTEANAKWLTAYAKEHSWERVLLITSRYHMRRSKLIFENVMKTAKAPVAVETLSVFTEPFEPGEWRSSFHGIRVTMFEYLKWIYYKFVWAPEP